MQTSQAGIDLIKLAEGFCPTVYMDEDKPAIGYGCDLSPEEFAQYSGQTMTEQEATDLLKFRVQAVEAVIGKVVTATLTQNQFDALVDFVYNVGPGHFETSTLLRKLNAGDMAGAADQFTRWDIAGGKVNEGLLARRKRERAMFLGE